MGTISRFLQAPRSIGGQERKRERLQIAQAVSEIVLAQHATDPETPVAVWIDPKAAKPFFKGRNSTSDKLHRLTSRVYEQTSLFASTEILPHSVGGFVINTFDRSLRTENRIYPPKTPQTPPIPNAA